MSSMAMPPRLGALIIAVSALALVAWLGWRELVKPPPPHNRNHLDQEPSHNGGSASPAVSRLTSILTSLEGKTAKEINHLIYDRSSLLRAELTERDFDTVLAWIANREKSPNLRAFLILSLQAFHDTRIGTTLEGVLKDGSEDAAVRTASLDYFVGNADRTIVPVLRELSVKVGAAELRMAAIYALGKLSDEADIRLLKETAISLCRSAEDSNLIVTIARAIATSSSAGVLQDVLEVISLLKDPTFRASGVLALAKIGSPEALAIALDECRNPVYWTGGSADTIAMSLTGALRAFPLTKDEARKVFLDLAVTHPSPLLRAQAAGSLATSMSSSEYLDFIDGAVARRDLAVARASVENVDELASTTDSHTLARKLIGIVQLNIHSGRESEQVSVAAASALGRLRAGDLEIDALLTTTVRQDRYHVAIRESALEAAYRRLTSAERHSEMQSLLQFCVQEPYWTGVSKRGTQLLVEYCKLRRDPLLTSQARSWIRAALENDGGSREDRASLSAAMAELLKLTE